MKYDDSTRILLPADAITLKIRPGHSVYIVGIPHDLRRQEADKIVRIITAHVDQGQ
jgi:hypothetical protein